MLERFSQETRSQLVNSFKAQEEIYTVRLHNDPFSDNAISLEARRDVSGEIAEKLETVSCQFAMINWCEDQAISLEAESNRTGSYEEEYTEAEISYLQELYGYFSNL